MRIRRKPKFSLELNASPIPQSSSHSIDDDFARGQTTPMNGKRKFISCYVPGECLRGQIHLRLFKNTVLKICIYLEGYMEIILKNGDKLKWKLLANSTQLWPNKNQVQEDFQSQEIVDKIDGLPIQEGEHILEFQLKIPEKCPPSYKAQQNKLRFRFVAELSYLNCWPCFRLPLKEKMNIMSVNLPIRISQHIDFAPFCHSRRPMPVQMFYGDKHLFLFSINLEKFCFTKKEEISIQIAPLDDYKENNLFSERCWLQVAVRFVQTIYIERKAKYVKRKCLFAGQINKKKMENNGQQGIEIIFPLRFSVVPSFSTPQVHIQHELHLKFRFQRTLWPLASYIAKCTIPIMVTEKKWMALPCSSNVLTLTSHCPWKSNNIEDKTKWNLIDLGKNMECEKINDSVGEDNSRCAYFCCSFLYGCANGCLRS